MADIKTTSTENAQKDEAKIIYGKKQKIIMTVSSGLGVVGNITSIVCEFTKHPNIQLAGLLTFVVAGSAACISAQPIEELKEKRDDFIYFSKSMISLITNKFER